MQRGFEQCELAAVALGVRAGRRGMRLRAVLVGLHVVSAGEDQAVDRVEHLLDPVLVGRHEHGPASGPFDGADVGVRDERGLDLPPVPP